MKVKSLKELKSGTDVRGYAVKTAEHDINLTDEAVYAIVRAFIFRLYEKSGLKRIKIAVGNDVRISCERIHAAVSKAISDSGCGEVYLGLCSTPSTFMFLKSESCDCAASIMITASHLPYDRNGLKFFTPEGGLEGSDVEEILSLAEKNAACNLGAATREERNFMGDYCRILINEVKSRCGEELPLSGKKIIVDAGNGAGGFFAEKVLKPLGADVSASIYLTPDGTFPNHIPNPEDKNAIRGLSRAVVKENADLGIIFDTDVDRAAVVDKNGEEINRNRLIALVAAIILKDKKGTIVTDSVTSSYLTEFITTLGGKHLRFKRGYKNVIDEAVRLNNAGEYAPVAIETSGHAAFYDNYFLDDGAYLITRILACMHSQAAKGKSISDLISGLKTPAEEAEIRLGFNELSKDFKGEGKSVIENLKILSPTVGGRLANDNHEGVRVFFDDLDGWFLVRMSVHDPVMPVNIECGTRGNAVKIANILYGLLTNFEFLRLDALTKFLN